MPQWIQRVAVLAAVAWLATAHPVTAQSAGPIPPAITTADTAPSRIGTLDFRDGAPSKATVDAIYDQIDFTHAYNAFVSTMGGVSIASLRRGLRSVGVKDSEVIVFSDLMDAKSLFLTANADTIYVIGVLDLTQGPMVVEVPPTFLGAIDDQWFRWVVDLGLPGPDRGQGGRYLVLPPGYQGERPEGGFFVARSMLDTPQRYPRAGSQSYPSPAAEPDADGSTTVYFAPQQPAGVKRGNWKTMPGKGWFAILRLYSPLEPFFDKSWRPSEIQVVR